MLFSQFTFVVILELFPDSKEGSFFCNSVHRILKE